MTTWHLSLGNYHFRCRGERKSTEYPVNTAENMGMIRNLKSWVGQYVRELGLHFERLRLPKSDRRIIFCVDDGKGGMSSGLRGYAISDHLRSLGWRSLVLPRQLNLAQRQRIIAVERPHILVLQSSRHPLNRPGLYPQQFCVYDIDDADFLDPDCVAVVNACAQESQAAIAGSRYVAEYLKQYCGSVEVIWTGSEPLANPESLTKLEPPVIAWACSDPHGYPAESQLVQDIFLKISNQLPCQFWLIGVRDVAKGEDFIRPIQARGIPCRALPFMPYEQLLETLSQVSIGLAPLLPEVSPYSAGKSFGKVLSYLNTDVAVIASDCVDHPLFFQPGENGFLASTLEDWIQCVDYLLMNPNERVRIAQQARQDYIRRLSTQAAAQRMDQFLRKCLESQGLN